MIVGLNCKNRVNQSKPIGGVSFVKVSFVQRCTPHLQSQKNSFQQEKLRKGAVFIFMNLR